MSGGLEGDLSIGTGSSSETVTTNEMDLTGRNPEVVPIHKTKGLRKESLSVETVE